MGLTMCFGSNRDVEHATMMLSEAFNLSMGIVSHAWSGTAPAKYDTEWSGLDHILINMLQCVHQMITGDHNRTEHKFNMLQTCESHLRRPGFPEAGRQIIRKMRLDLAQVWERECEVWAAKNEYVG